jgi:hypothetical protein
MTNTEMPGLVKIGRTSREPKQRASELRTTGVPGHFRVKHFVWSPDAAKSEGLAHHMLASKRVSGDREFFRVSTKDAIAVVNRAANVKKTTGMGTIIFGFLIFLFIVAFFTGKLG